MKQITFAQNVEICGIGLHSGCESRAVFMPAEENSGIVFVRSDLKNESSFPALFSNVVDTRNCTCLGNRDKQVVSTIEHVMAALSVLGIDNARIEVNNPELPIMDGSAKIFYETLKNVPLKTLKAERKFVKVKQRVDFEDGKGASVALLPAKNFEVCLDIDFPSKVVGHQEFDAVISEDIFASQIAPARTFCEKYQVDYLKSVGLIKGGSLDNAVVLDGDTILNEGGFLVEDECVKHKVLDAIGDMFTAGYRIKGKLLAHHSGHFHNNQILKILFSNPNNYEIVEE